MKKALIIAVIASILFGCKVEQIPTRTDSVRVEYRLDSIYLYERDSIYVDRWRENDTIYITTEKWMTRYKDVIKIQHDTIKSENTIVQEVKYTPSFYKICTAGFWVFVVALFLWIVWKIYKVIKVL